MHRDEWDAPYIPPLRGALKLVGTVVLVLLLVVAAILTRFAIVAAFS